MDHVKSLKCLICGKEYAPNQIDYVCPDHGDEGIVDVQYDYDLIGRRLNPQLLEQNPDRTIWRYRPLLPIEPESPVPPLTVGGTPLYKTDRLAAALKLKHMWVKDDGRLPTASFKDRASAIAVVKGRERKAEIITTASTATPPRRCRGCAPAWAAQCDLRAAVRATRQDRAAARLRIDRFVGPWYYDDAFELCLQAAKEFGWYNRNTGYNPYMTEGKKTASLEICEQLGWDAPDRMFVSVGDGCIIGGLHKGLKDLMALGWINKLPKLMGVQAAGSAALYEAWRTNRNALDMQPIDAQTIADSISAGLPRRSHQSAGCRARDQRRVRQSER